MLEMHLSNEEFFARLSELFEERITKGHGSVFMTQKRMAFNDTPEPAAQTISSNLFPELLLSNPLPIIIRATNGKFKDHKAKKIKLSTIVESAALEGFFAKYAEVCKSGMSALKKRDRSKGKKKMKAKKRKVVAAGGSDEASKV